MSRFLFKILEESVSQCWDKENLFVMRMTPECHALHPQIWCYYWNIKYPNIFEPGKDIHPSLLPIMTQQKSEAFPKPLWLSIIFNHWFYKNYRTKILQIETVLIEHHTHCFPKMFHYITIIHHHCQSSLTMIFFPSSFPIWYF